MAKISLVIHETSAVPAAKFVLKELIEWHLREAKEATARAAATKAKIAKRELNIVARVHAESANCIASIALMSGGTTLPDLPPSSTILASA